MKPSICFFKIGSFSHINENVRQILASGFPGHDVIVIDVLDDVLLRSRTAAVRALGDVLRQYSWPMLSRRRHPKSFFSRTCSGFQYIRAWARDRVRTGDVAFTFQTQSLFDAGCADVPHFLYTDHTLKANRHYEQPAVAAPDWVELEETIYPAARLSFTSSELVRRSIIDDYHIRPERVICVYSGFNIGPGEAPPASKPPTGIILFIGLNWARKGGPDLVAAFEHVLKRHPAAQLWIAGCAPRVNVPNCRIFGQVDLEKLPRLYAEADIFCLPSRKDAAPSVLHEAAAFALPVVSTEVGGTPDRVIHGQTGFLVRPGDVDALAAALSRLLGDPEQARRMGACGRRLVLERFNWDVVGRKMTEAIRCALHTDAPAVESPRAIASASSIR